MDAMIKVGKKARAIRTDYHGSGYYDWRIPIITDDWILIGIYFKRDRTEANDWPWPKEERWYYLHNVDVSDYDGELEIYHVSAVKLACMWAIIIANELTLERENMIRRCLGENET